MFMSKGLEEERARIVATLRLVADRIEKLPVHGVQEPLTFVRSLTDALASWTARELPGATEKPER